MTKDELKEWIKIYETDGYGEPVIDGGYELIEVEGDWKLVIEGNASLANMGMTEFPNIFHSVSNKFYCYDNYLTSLDGCPHSIKEIYSDNNQLTSLKHCPSSVKKLDCSENKLTSLEHCPNSVKTLVCNHNQITSLEYCPLSLEEFAFDFSDEEYKAYVIETKDNLEKQASDERVKDIEDILGLDR